MIRLLKYFFGYAVFSASGKFPERFLNLLQRSGIYVWGLRREEDGIRAVVRADEYKKLKLPAKKAGMKLKVKLKRGLPFLLHKNRRRIGMPVGFVLFLAIIGILPLFIWQVDIECTASNVDTDLLRYQLAQCGLRPGVLKKSVDREYVKSIIMSKNPAVSWIGVNSGTSRAYIDVRGSIYPPIREDWSEPCNLKAAFEGQVIDIQIEEGEPVVKKGEAVAKGDLLVGGIVGTRAVHARGIVSAETVRELEAYVPYRRIETVRGDEKVRLIAVFAFGKEIPLYFKKPQGEFVTEFSERKFEFFGLRPEISIRNLIMIPLSKVSVELSREQAEAEAMLQADELQRVHLRGTEIKKCLNRIIEDENGVKIVRTLTCIENIAAPEKINIKNSQKN